MQIITPSKKDPRVYMVGVLILFLLLTQLFLGFSQTREQILVSFLTCLIVDFGLTYATTGKFAVPMSGIVSGLSLSLLLNSGTRVMPFFLCGVLSVCSKYIVKHNGRHFFNPTNFGLAILLLTGIGSVTPGYQWGGGTTALWIALSMGGMTLFRVKRFVLIFAFLGFFTISATALMMLFHEPFSLAFGLMTGAPFQLFTFFMLPDPRTTPASVSGQVKFALGVVMFDFILRVFRADVSLFLALFFFDVLVLILAIAGNSFRVSLWPAQAPFTGSQPARAINSDLLQSGEPCAPKEVSADVPERTAASAD
jgi:enediyne biosynthesis protein E5